MPVCMLVALEPRSLYPVTRPTRNQESFQLGLPQQFIQKFTRILSNFLHSVRQLRKRSDHRFSVFMTPVMGSAACCVDNWPSDDVVMKRISLYAAEANLRYFEDTDHYTIGLDHAWDLTRRYRGLVRDDLLASSRG